MAKVSRSLAETKHPFGTILGWHSTSPPSICPSTAGCLSCARLCVLQVGTSPSTYARTLERSDCYSTDVVDSGGSPICRIAGGRWTLRAVSGLRQARHPRTLAGVAHFGAPAQMRCRRPRACCTERAMETIKTAACNMSAPPATCQLVPMLLALHLRRAEPLALGRHKGCRRFTFLWVRLRYPASSNCTQLSLSVVAWHLKQKLARFWAGSTEGNQSYRPRTKRPARGRVLH